MDQTRVSIPTLENHQLQPAVQEKTGKMSFEFQFLPLKIINCNTRAINQRLKLNDQFQFLPLKIINCNLQLETEKVVTLGFQFLPLKIINCNCQYREIFRPTAFCFNSYPWKSSIATVTHRVNYEYYKEFQFLPLKIINCNSAQVPLEKGEITFQFLPLKIINCNKMVSLSDLIDLGFQFLPLKIINCNLQRGAKGSGGDDGTVSIPTLENHQLQRSLQQRLKDLNEAFQFLPLKIINCNSTL